MAEEVPPMVDTCSKHSFEVAAGVCRQCRNSYCDECLVFAFGPKKPPYCISCALSAAGVRRKGAATNPRLRKKGIFGRREIVEEAPREELGFNDVHIELPEEAEHAPVMSHTTRREAPVELVAAVSAAESAHTTLATGATSTGIGGSNTDDHAGVLADWAASLNDTDAADRGASPTSGIAAWPEQHNQGGSNF